MKYLNRSFQIDVIVDTTRIPWLLDFEKIILLHLKVQNKIFRLPEFLNLTIFSDIEKYVIVVRNL